MGIIYGILVILEMYDIIFSISHLIYVEVSPIKHIKIWSVTNNLYGKFYGDFPSLFWAEYLITMLQLSKSSTVFNARGIMASHKSKLIFIDFTH